MNTIERLKQIRERAQETPHYFTADFHFLLSLLDSQAAQGSRRAQESAADIVREWSEHDMNESYDSSYLAEEFGAGHLEERITAAITDAATWMRDRCVERVKEYLRHAKNIDIAPLIDDLQALTLEGEQEKR